MKKGVLIIAFVLLCMASVLCEDDRRRYLFGEDYRKITEISKDSVRLLRDNADELRKLAKEKHGYFENGIKEPKFFKEQHGSAEFYRVVFEIENPYGRYAAFYGEDLQFFLLAHKGTLFILNADYLVEGQSGDGTVHSSDEVIYSNTHVVKRGDSYDIIEHHTKTRQDVYIDPEGGSDMKIEDSGGGKAAVYALEEVINAAEIKAGKTGSLVTLSRTGPFLTGKRSSIKRVPLCTRFKMRLTAIPTQAMWRTQAITVFPSRYISTMRKRLFLSCRAAKR